MMGRWIGALGLLRLMLAMLTLALTAVALFAGDSGGVSVWQLFRGAVAPALATMTAFGLPLDMLMAAIYRSGAQGSERDRYSAIIRIECVLFIVLVLVWAPVIGSRLG
jgi:hypothetical protein